MTDDLTPHGLHRRSLLLGGAGLGAGLVTSAAALDFPAAAAGTRTTQHWHGRFTDPATPDWHYLPFTVPRGVRAIDVRYDFQPHDTGLGFSTNVVDIGMFDPSGKGLGNADGFRGWSGGARRHFRITDRWATPGYLAGPVTPGRWHVILGPFLITPPGTPWHVTVTLEHGAPLRAGVPCRSTRPPSVPGTAAGWYRGDLHTHSVYSDGRWTPSELVVAGPGQRPGLPRHLRPQHQRGHPGLRQGRARRLPGGQRRGGHHPERALARDRHHARHLDRLALPGRRPPAPPLHRPHPQPAAASPSPPIRPSRYPAPAGTSDPASTRWTRSRCGTVRGRSSTR